MNLIQCMMTQSTCYRGTTRGRPVGVLWHDTGAGNPELRRYVQPDDGDPQREALLRQLGKNAYGNDWNHQDLQAGLNAWVGKLADGSVASVQTMPWNYRPWGCGGGSRGSCNGSALVTDSPFWIQFEICDDGYRDRDYFQRAYKEAVELTAFLCREFGIDPDGTVSYNGVSVPAILCHADSHKLGLGSGHSDVLDWFKVMGKSMADVRKDVKAQIGAMSVSAAEPVPKKKTTIYRVQVGAYTVKKNADAFLKEVKAAGFENAVIAKVELEPEFEPYKVQVTAQIGLNVRSGPGGYYAATGVLEYGGKVTILEENNGWGRLANGWICLDYTRKI